MIEVFGVEAIVKTGRKPAIKQYVDLKGKDLTLDQAHKLALELQRKLEAEHPGFDPMKSERAVHYTLNCTRKAPNAEEQKEAPHSQVNQPAPPAPPVKVLYGSAFSYLESLQ